MSLKGAGKSGPSAIAKDFHLLCKPSTEKSLASILRHPRFLGYLLWELEHHLLTFFSTRR